MDIILAGFAKGWTLNMGLIIAIGAQNAFMLAQGIRRRFVFVTALTCSLCDAILIAVGVAFTAAATGHWAGRIVALATAHNTVPRYWADRRLGALLTALSR